MIAENYFFYSKAKLVRDATLCLCFAILWTLITIWIGMQNLSTHCFVFICFVLTTVILWLATVKNFISLCSGSKPILYFDKYSLILYPTTRKEIVIPWENITYIYRYDNTLYPKNRNNKNLTYLLVEVNNPQHIMSQSKSFFQRQYIRYCIFLSNCPIMIYDNLNIPLKTLQGMLFAELSQHHNLPPDTTLDKLNPRILQLLNKSKNKTFLFND